MSSVQIFDVGLLVQMYVYFFIYLIHPLLYIDSEWKMYLYTCLLFATCTLIPLYPLTLTLLFPYVPFRRLSYLGAQ